MSPARRFNRPDHRGAVADALAAMGPHRVCERLGVERGKSDRGTNIHPRFVCPKHGGSALDVDVVEGRGLLVDCKGCGELKGTVFDLVAAVHGLNARRDFPKVLRLAAEIAGIRLDDVRTGAPLPPRVVPPVRPVEAPKPVLDVDTFDRIVAHMFDRGRLDRLDDEDEVRAYLRGRRLLDLATDAGWFALPRIEAQRALVDELRDLVGVDALRLSGLVNDGATAFRHPANRLAIPWRAHGVDGLVVTLQRRRLDAGEPRYVFPQGRSPLWPFVVVDDLEDLEDEGNLAIVEGAVDVLALRAGLREKGERVLVVGLPGVQSWRDEWRSLLEGKHVRIAIDPDKAGESAVDKLLAQCTNAALSAQRWRPKGAKDWADAWERG